MEKHKAERGFLGVRVQNHEVGERSRQWRLGGVGEAIRQRTLNKPSSVERWLDDSGPSSSAAEG